MLKSMARRRLHFIGTMPQFSDARAAFTWQLGEPVRGQLRRLSGGETGPRLLWFVPLVKELKGRPEIRAVRDGDWSSYEDTDLLTVRRGQGLHIPLRLAQYVSEDRAALASVVDGDPGLPLQVGIPGYLDMALFTFGPLGAIRHSRRFLLAVADQISAIAAFYAPLRQLREMPLIAGIAHELQSPADQLRVRDLVEQATGRAVDIATSCGLGRRTADEAERAVQAMLKLAAD